MAEMEMISTSQSGKRGREREKKCLRQLCYRESWNQPSVKIRPREMTWQMHSLQTGWQGVEHMAHFQLLCRVGYLVNTNKREERNLNLILCFFVSFLMPPLISSRLHLFIIVMVSKARRSKCTKNNNDKKICICRACSLSAPPQCETLKNARG